MALVSATARSWKLPGIPGGRFDWFELELGLAGPREFGLGFERTG